MVLVIDAARMGKAPGEYGLLKPSEISGATFSTHMLPLPVTLSYLEYSCGCTTAYLGIEPATTEQGIGLSPAVKAGVGFVVVGLLATALGRCLCQQRIGHGFEFGL